MSWVAVAKKDYQDAIRSPYFWAVTAAFTLLVGFFLFQVTRALLRAVSEAEQSNDIEIELTTDVFIQQLGGALSLGTGGSLGILQPLVPVLAIVAAYTAIAGERDTGTLKLLLSLPNSRRDVILGKLLGRSGVLVTPLLIGFTLGALAFPISAFTFVPTTYALFVGLTLLFAVVFVGFTVGVSAAMSTSRRAAVATFGIVAYLYFLWSGLARNLAGFTGELLDLQRRTILEMELFIRLLNPIAAYQSLVHRIQISGPIEARSLLMERSSRPATAEVQQFMMRSIFRDSVPWYFSDAMVVVLLLLWLVVPLGIGYFVFNEADL